MDENNGQNELTITRLINAPTETVFRAWVERQEQWWAPRPWKTQVIEQDLRAGGRSAMIMSGPNGEHMPLEGVFLEVIPNRKIVTTDAYTAGWLPQTPFMTAIFTFDEENGQTRYTASARHWDDAARKQHEDMGFYTGWRQCADQLAELVEGQNY